MSDYNELRQMIEDLKARVAELEEQVTLCDFVPCADCGIVFRDADAYAQHECEADQ